MAFLSIIGVSGRRSGAGSSPRRNAVPITTAMIAVASLLGAMLPAWGTRAAPSIPTSDDVVLERVPGSRDASSARLHGLNAALARNRHDLPLALQVARLDLDQSRRLGDPRFLGRAQAALAPWPIEAADAPPDVLLLQAIIQQSNHDFDGSVATLRRVLAAKPDTAQAWLVLAAVHQAQARYDDALRDCGQVATRTLGLVPDTCTASVMSLVGRAPLSLRAVAISLDQNMLEAHAEPSVAAWALSLAAETADRIGDPAAESYYRKALAAAPDDPYVLGAWSDWLLDSDRPGDVIALLADRTRIDPLLLRLALAEQRIGAPGLAQHVGELASRFEASRLRGDTVHRREEARFELELQHRPELALRLAEANWTVQREPADARILLEAARAAGHPEAADPVRLWLQHNGVQDLRLTALANQAAPAALPGKS